MGWFFNKDSKNSSQNNPEELKQGQQSFFNVKSSFSSKKRYCKNDPEDDQYMICKTVIKDNNGTREEEERVPKNRMSDNLSGETSEFEPFSFFRSPFNNRPQEEKVFDRFNSFFIQPSFFDMHNSSLPHDQQNSQIQSHSSSYSQSRSCHSDPENPEYLICKSKVQDENGIKEYEERVKIADQFMVPSFRGEFEHFGNEVDKQIHNMMRDINKGFNFMVPFIGPVMGFLNELDRLDQNQSLPGNGHKKHNHHNSFKNNSSSHHSRFHQHTGHKKKDTNVYDL